MNVNLAYYNKKDWNRFLELIDDRASMQDTWEEWHTSYQKAKKGFSAQGFIVHDYVVDMDELDNYCKLRGIKNDGKARSEFVSRQNK